jgi:hypothetical protein
MKRFSRICGARFSPRVVVFMSNGAFGGLPHRFRRS